jgi:hypothetical protein
MWRVWWGMNSAYYVLQVLICGHLRVRVHLQAPGGLSFNLNLSTVLLANQNIKGSFYITQLYRPKTK